MTGQQRHWLKDVVEVIEHAPERISRFTNWLWMLGDDIEHGLTDRVAVDFFGEPEVIGNEECPVMYRWTLVNRFGCKLLLHHFLPNGDDPEPHDHPFDFVTLVLSGSYIDESWDEIGRLTGSQGLAFVKVEERMTRGMLRRRRAEHMHRTLISPNGCWTIIATGPKRREWGFLWRNVWMPMQKYLDERGEAAIRCDR